MIFIPFQKFYVSILWFELQLNQYSHRHETKGDGNSVIIEFIIENMTNQQQPNNLTIKKLLTKQ